MAIVYQHIRLDTNEVFYIGIGKSVKRAFSKYNRNRFWKSIVKKTEYNVEILHNNLSEDEAKKLEMFYIDKYGRRDNGSGILCNLTDGGDGINGFIFNQDVKSKMSISAFNRVRLPRTEEHNKNISEAKKGYNHNFDSRIKMSNSSKRKKLSDEQVLEIIKSYSKGGITQKELGLIYGVRQDTISCIINGKKRKIIYELL
jgi:hypothetical protein